MDYKIEFGFGIEKDRNQAEISPERAEEKLRAICADAANDFGGYTVYRTQGGWVNKDGILVRESGITLLILILNSSSEDAGKEARDFARVIKEIFCQEAVAVTITPVEMFYV